MSETNDMRQEFEAWFPLQSFGDNALHQRDGKYTFEPALTYWLVWQAATERATASQWRPIETASMHQTVLVSVVDCGVTFGSCIGSCGWSWEELDDEPADAIVSHWMPLPAPPAIRQGGAA